MAKRWKKKRSENKSQHQHTTVQKSVTPKKNDDFVLSEKELTQKTFLDIWKVGVIASDIDIGNCPYVKKKCSAEVCPRGVEGMKTCPVLEIIERRKTG